MQILVIAATAAEIEPFVGTNGPADILVTGVGVPATLYHLQKRIHQIGYDLVIQAGIAGSFNPDLFPGKTVVVNKDCFADIGMVEQGDFIPVTDTPLADRNQYPFENGWLVNPYEIVQTCALPAVSAITVNKVSDSAVQTQQFENTYHADIESMEGAALHYVCLQEQIPFLQLRSVSNVVGERDKSKWWMREAIANLNHNLSNLVNRFYQQ